jgi:hypothetical protein
MIDQDAAAERAEALLALPLDVGQQRFGTDRRGTAAGNRAVLVVKDNGEARYLGSQSIEYELERAAEDPRRGL